MSSSRTKSRKHAMTILYQINMYKKNKIDYVVDDVIKEVLDFDNEFVKEIVYGVITHEDELDKLANKYLDGWNIDRLGNTDKAILQIGLYELIYTDTPNIVCINEAVELAKAYSDDSVRKMINGVLDKVLHEELNE